MSKQPNELEKIIQRMGHVHNVILTHDEETPWDIKMDVLIKYFNKNAKSAAETIREAEVKGEAVIDSYGSKDIAATKVGMAIDSLRNENFKMTFKIKSLI